MKIKDSKIASSFFEKYSDSIIKEIKNANVVQICRFNDGVKELFDTGVIEKVNENLYSQLSYYDDELSQRVGNRNKRGAIEALVKTFEALENQSKGFIDGKIVYAIFTMLQSYIWRIDQF